MSIFLELFITFLKIGTFTFGGGYAMISVIENNCVEKKKWMTHDEMMDITVIAESTPGPIAINCATFVGYKIAGFLGAVFSTIGVVIPSLVIILVISSFLDNFLDIPIIANAFLGIKTAVGILIFHAGMNMMNKMPKQRLSVIILFFSFTTMMVINVFAFNFSSINLMLIAALVSLISFGIEEAKKGGNKK